VPHRGSPIAFFLLECSQQEKDSAMPASRARGSAVVAVILSLVAGGGFLWSRSRTDAASASRVDHQTKDQAKGSLHLETFVLNLADPGQRSYLRVGIDLGLAQPLAQGEEAPIAPVRDTILGVLAESRVDELQTAKGKSQLKEEVLHALRERVPELKVEEVYFTEFLIQR
jgi:flagellar FliL protein